MTSEPSRKKESIDKKLESFNDIESSLYHVMIKFIFLSSVNKKGRSASLGLRGVVVICFCIVSIITGLFFSGIQYATNRVTEILAVAREQVTAGWEQELTLQGKELSEARLNVEKSLDAIASRISLLQGHLIRLDVLGYRLVNMTEDLHDLEFTADNQSDTVGLYLGVERQAIKTPDFLQMLDTLEIIVQDRSDKFTAIESMLIKHILQEQVLPAGSPTKGGWLSSSYGYRTDPLTGKIVLHDGIDITGKPGTLITSVASGIVIWSGPRYGYGELIEIDHGGGYITRYAHNKENLVSIGEKIEKGEVIAVMGSTGRSTGRHVHFMVLKDGSHINPKDFLTLK